MLKVSLFRRTLSSYKASLVRGELCSLYGYCKIHNVSYKNMRYWMKTQSIELPEIPELYQSGSVESISSESHPQKMIPLTILSPEEPKREVSPSSLLQEVSISVSDNMVVNIRGISPSDLASIILTCQSR